MGVQESQNNKSVTQQQELTTQQRRHQAWGVGRDAKLNQKNIIGIHRKRKRGLIAGHPFARVIGLDRWLIQKMLQVAGNPPLSISLWDGREVTSCADPAAELTIHDRAALLKLVVDPELHFGDLYSSGRVEVSGDLVRFLEVIYARLRDTDKVGLLRRYIIWWGHRKIANSLSKARDNIYHTMISAIRSMKCGLIRRSCSTPVRIFITRILLLKRHRLRNCIMFAESSNYSREIPWWKPDVAGVDWRVSWPGNMA